MESDILRARCRRLGFVNRGSSVFRSSWNSIHSAPHASQEPAVRADSVGDVGAYHHFGYLTIVVKLQHRVGIENTGMNISRGSVAIGTFTYIS